MREVRTAIASLTAGALTVLAACGDQPMAPREVSSPASIVAIAAVGEGQLRICKVGSGSQIGSFTLDWDIRRNSDNSLYSSGSVVLTPGACVLAASIPTTVSGRYHATVTEQAPPADWALTDIGVLLSGNSPSVPTIDLPNRTATGPITNDLGIEFTFTNTYTPPTGEIGDFVWKDVNGNGIQDVSEGGISGLTVTLGGDASASTTTDVNGAYLFSGLSAGSYTVTVSGPSGYTASPSNQGGDANTDSNGSPAAVSLATSSSIDHSIDFGFVPPAPPGPSCTLTQGYWKNHTQLWDASGERVVTTTDLFFNSGKSYITLMNTPPAGGNTYIQLAHQYIAAKLNVNLGSDPTIIAALAQAETIFNGFANGVWTSKDKALTKLAATLDDYNNGVTGPGHCN
jgi:hypothetical protein